MPSGPFPELRFMIDGQQYSSEILSIHDDGDDLTTLGRMPPGVYTELLAILLPSHPGLPAEARQRFARGPMSIMFLRAGDGCDVQDLGIPPNDPGALVTVHAPLLKKEFT